MSSGNRPGDHIPIRRHGSTHNPRHHPPAMVIWLLAFAAASAVALTSFSLADGKIAPGEVGTVAIAGG